MAAIPGWQRALLGLLHAPVTPANVQFLNAWQRAEGGTARYNPLNTTQRAPGATSYNSVGVRNYTTPQSGLHATVETLLNGRYTPIVSELRSGHATAMQLAQAVEHSPWGTGGGVLRVLGGGSVPSTAGPATPVPSVAPQGEHAATGPPDLPAPPVDTSALRHQALQSLIGQIGHKTPDYTEFIGGLQAVKAAEAQAPPAAAAAPNLDVKVQHGAKVGKAAVGAVALAKEYLGTPYHWGGASPSTGFDCSGLLQYAYAKQGVKIPRTTYEQFKSGTPVARGQLRAGDAVFFEATSAGPGHVGIFLGNGTFLESPHTGANVRISKLAGRSDFVGARRFA